MKHEYGLNILAQRKFSRAVLAEASQLLETLLESMFDASEACIMRQIASMWCSGLTWTDIANQLGMTPNEVRRYLKIMEELCADAILACLSDEYVEQVTLFGDTEDVTVKRIVSDDRTHSKYKKHRPVPLFNFGW